MINLIAPTKDPLPWLEAINSLAPDIQITVWPEIDPDAEFALVWNPPPGSLSCITNLKCICAMGAGVDQLVSDPTIPADIPIVRLLDPRLSEDMFDYVYHAIESYRLGLMTYQQQQSNRQWLAANYPDKSHLSILIMGLGSIGQQVASQLSRQGYQVYGWSRTPKEIAAVECLHGLEALYQTAAKVAVVVCLLPLTRDTEDILNRQLFQAMTTGSTIINVARGGHMNESDLLEAINSGHLSEAYLDVFREEPLPEQHPFWTHTRIRITPHIASLTNPQSVTPQIIDNYRRIKDKIPLKAVIDRKIGY